MQCTQCGREFSSVRSTSKYCSPKCRVTANRVTLREESVTLKPLSVTKPPVSVTKPVTNNKVSVTETPSEDEIHRRAEQETVSEYLRRGIFGGVTRGKTTTYFDYKGVYQRNVNRLNED